MTRGALVLLLCFVATAVAQRPPMPPMRGPADSFACLADIDAFCLPEKAQVATTKLPLLVCLAKNAAALHSTECAALVRASPDFQCAFDATQLCAGMTDRGAIASCLHSHQQQVSAGCQSAINNMPHHQPRPDDNDGDDEEGDGDEEGMGHHGRRMHGGGAMGLIFVLAAAVLVGCVAVRCIRKRRQMRQARFDAAVAAAAAQQQQQQQPGSAPAAVQMQARPANQPQMAGAPVLVASSAAAAPVRVAVAAPAPVTYTAAPVAYTYPLLAETHAEGGRAQHGGYVRVPDSGDV